MQGELVAMRKITDEISIGSRKDIFLDATIDDSKTVVEITPKSKEFKFPKIKGYLNVAEDLNVTGVELPKVGLVDGEGNSKEVLKRAVNTLESLIKEHGKVMVFCHKGESRSPLVVLAYLHVKKSMPIGEAYDLIRFAKPDIKISPFLSLMLCELLSIKYFECDDKKTVQPIKTSPPHQMFKDTGNPTPKTKQTNAQPSKKRGNKGKKK